jgi:hypothetical protein
LFLTHTRFNNSQELQQPIKDAVANVKPEMLINDFNNSMLFAARWTSFRAFSPVAYFYFFVNIFHAPVLGAHAYVYC